MVWKQNLWTAVAVCSLVAATAAASAGAVGNNAMIAGQTVRLQPGATVGHDARLAGGEVRSEGRVGHDLTISTGRAEIGGDIGGVVNASARRVTVLPDALVRGDLVVRAPEPPVISPGAGRRVRTHATSAATIITGMAIPMTAKTMWNASDRPICHRA